MEFINDGNQFYNVENQSKLKYRNKTNKKIKPLHEPKKICQWSGSGPWTAGLPLQISFFIYYIGADYNNTIKSDHLGQTTV